MNALFATTYAFSYAFVNEYSNVGVVLDLYRNHQDMIIDKAGMFSDWIVTKNKRNFKFKNHSNVVFTTNGSNLKGMFWNLLFIPTSYKIDSDSDLECILIPEICKKIVYYELTDIV